MREVRIAYGHRVLRPEPSFVVEAQCPGHEWLKDKVRDRIFCMHCMKTINRENWGWRDSPIPTVRRQR